MQERRKSFRGLTYLGAHIAFNHRFSTMDCLVRNMSQNGAKIVFSNPVSVPDEFDIHINNRGESKRARMIWRDDTQIGIALIQQDSCAVVSIETARRMRDLQAECDALAKRVAELDGSE